MRAHAGGMGVRVTLRSKRVEEFGRRGDGEWTARHEEYSGTLLVAYLRAGRSEEVRRFYRPEDWARVEIG